MAIREAAIEAYENSRQDRIEVAAQHLLNTVLYDPEKSGPVVNRNGLELEHLDWEADLFIFRGSGKDKDDVGAVYLAVNLSNEEEEPHKVTRVVRGEEGEWVASPRRTLTTLVELGEVLTGEGRN